MPSNYLNSCSLTYSSPKSGLSIVHLLFLLLCCSAETEFISLEVLKLEKQIAEKQVNTIYFIRVSLSKDWVPFTAGYLSTSSSGHPLGFKSKMAVTPTEVVFTGDEDDSCSVHEEHVERNDVIGLRRVTLFTISLTKRQIK